MSQMRITIWTFLITDGTACADRQYSVAELVAPAGMQYVDISSSGMNLNILVPD